MMGPMDSRVGDSKVVSTSLTLQTSDGVVIDGNVYDLDEPIGGLVMLHPHPLYGGDQHHPLVVSICEAVSESGWLAIRFDFRGTNRSEGVHSQGTDELFDVDAAVRELARRLGDKPIIVAGYSFGASVALRCPNENISARIAIATPIALLTSGPTIPESPTLLIHPRHDQYTSEVDLRDAVGLWPHSSMVDVVMVEGADHFLNGFVQHVSKLVCARALAVAT
jgi:uncharacterized protein